MRTLCLLFFALSLSACSPQQFDCPYKEGARCLSVSEIDQKINAGEILQPGTKSNTTKVSLTHAKPIALELEGSIENSPLRTSETILTLWVAPFYSIDGTYHEQQRLHFVAREATWGGNAEVGEEN